jgi:pimeloyl-ACP methyl ester carboxylesterase
MPTFLYRGTKIYYDHFGFGTPIVFVHPPAMGRKVFHYQVHLEKYFQCIFPDLSGHGDSVGPYKKVSIPGYAKEIEALLDHLQIKKAVICGYSSGGAVAQEFALSFPERTSGLILSGGFSEVQSLGFKYEHIAGMYFVKHFPHFLAWLISESHTTDEALSRVLYTHMLKANRRMWFEFYEQSLRYTCIGRLHKLKAPLFLMYGSRDFVNQHLRSYEKYTKYQAAIVPKVSHQLPTKKWQVFNQLITGFVKSEVEG